MQPMLEQVDRKMQALDGGDGVLLAHALEITR